jgi:hypothetical protein
MLTRTLQLPSDVKLPLCSFQSSMLTFMGSFDGDLRGSRDPVSTSTLPSFKIFNAIFVG